MTALVRAALLGALSRACFERSTDPNYNYSVHYQLGRDLFVHACAVRRSVE